MVARGWTHARWEVTAVTANGHGAALKGDENILESDSGNGCTTL